MEEIARVEKTARKVCALRNCRQHFEDLVQEGLRALIERGDDGRTEGVMLDYLRSERRGQLVSQGQLDWLREDGEETPEQRVLRHQQQQMLRQRIDQMKNAVSGLPSRDQLVIRRLDLEGDTQQRVAQDIGVVQQRVSAIRRSAFKRIRPLISSSQEAIAA